MIKMATKKINIGHGLVVNGYSTDTHVNILDRIAIKLNTLPKYIRLTPRDVDLTKVDVVVADNILSPILNSNDVTFSSDAFPPDTENGNNAYALFVATHRGVGSGGEGVESAAVLYAMDNANRLYDKKASDIWPDRQTIIDNYHKNFDELKERVLAEEDRRRVVEDVRPVEISELDVRQMSYAVDFDTDSSYTTFSLFDSLSVNDAVPFAVFESLSNKKFYKIRDGYVPEKTVDEKFISPDVIYMLVDVTLTETSKYTSAWVRVKDKLLELNFILPTSPTNANREMIISRIDECFHVGGQPLRSSGGSVVPVIREIDATAYVILPRQAFDSVLFSDMIMNDPIISPILGINERIRVYKKGDRDLYIYIFDGDGKQLGTCKIVNRLTTRHNEYGFHMPEGTSYVRCLVHSKTKSELEDIQSIVAKLFAYYNTVREGIQRSYAEFSPGTVRRTAVVGEQRRGRSSLDAVDPDMFVKGHSRQCQNKVTIVTDENADTYESYPKMKFPTKGEGVPQTYVCATDPNLRYPGLIRNNLDNKDKFPFLPCCYRLDQSKSKDSNWAEYFYNVESAGKQKHYQNVYISDKILQPDAVGILPAPLTSYFRTVDVDPRYEFVRVGVGRSPLSAIECIVVALNPDYGREQVRSIVNEKFNTLKTTPYILASSQEMYRYTVDERRKMIDGNKCRAAYFFRSLEILFDCNIFVFVADKQEQSKAHLLIPDHRRGYLKFQPTKQTILLYEHWGSERDNLEYPQCELLAIRAVTITRQQIIRTERVWNPNSIIVAAIFSTLNSLSTTYINSRPVETATDPFASIDPLLYDAVAQRLDEYGKCRALRITATTTGDTVGSLIIDPCPPFALPEEDHIAAVDNFQLLHPILDQVEWQRLDRRTSSHVVELRIRSMGQFIIAPTARMPPIPSVAISTSDSDLTRFLYMKKTDEVVDYGKSYRLVEMLKVAALQANAVAQSDYPLVVGRQIVRQSPETVAGLIFETKKNLYYGIDLANKSLKKSLATIDFRPYPKETIVESDESYANVVAVGKESASTDYISPTLKPEFVSPYYMLYRNIVHLVQFIDIPSIDTVMAAITIWRRDKYNPIVVATAGSDPMTSMYGNTADFDVDDRLKPRYFDVDMNQIVDDDYGEYEDQTRHIIPIPVVVLDYKETKQLAAPYAVLMRFS